LLEGDIHTAQKSWKNAATAYRNGLNISPNGDLAGRLYLALLQDNQAAAAKNTADAWVKAHPQDFPFRLFLADVANRRKDYAAAAEQYRAILAVAPKNPLVLNNLAWSLGQMNDPKATAYAEEANTLAPNQPAIMETLGSLYVAQGKTAAGLDLLAKAVALAPQNPDLQLSQARAFIKAGKKAEAKQALDKLAKLGDKFAGQAEVQMLIKRL
jgi:Tfp pilus assembly protein PilF